MRTDRIRFVLALLIAGVGLGLFGEGKLFAQTLPGAGAAAVPVQGAAGAPAPSPAPTTTPPAVTTPAGPFTIRLEDIAYVQGIRPNQLTGLGLVTGLGGKGDTSGSGLLQRAVENLVTAFGLQVPQSDLRSRNCAVVMVTATLPAFAHPGDRIPVTVSSIGDATDLSGGILLQTNLKAANGEVYAVAQGAVADTANSYPRTVGDVPDGALVERGTNPTFVQGGKVQIVLRDPSFITANAAVDAIQKSYPNAGAVAVDPATIEVTIPQDMAQNPVGFIAGLDQITLVPDASDTVVINPRSGVVVVGANVRIGKVAVSYRNTQIRIGDELRSPYLDDFSSNKNPFVLGNTATVDDLVSVLKDAGVEPQAIIEILKAVARAGALYGRLVVM